MRHSPRAAVRSKSARYVRGRPRWLSAGHMTGRSANDSPSLDISLAASFKWQMHTSVVLAIPSLPVACKITYVQVWISKRLQINQISIHWGLVKSILGHKYSGILDSYKKERGSSLCTHRERSPRYIALERKRMVCCNASICVLVCLENISGRIHSISATAAVMFREGKWGAKKGGGLLWVWTMCT